jgi:bifunctional enzyme CysN/CysC
VYRRTVDEYGAFLEQIGVQPAAFLPVSGREGDNLIQVSSAMPWYQGPSLLEVLDAFDGVVPPRDQPFRMPVQDVYKFTANDDDRRIVAGTVAAGTVSVGDDIVFYPSGKRSRIKSVESFNSPPAETVGAGMAAGFTLEEQIYVTRGEIATRTTEPRPAVTTRIRANVFWLGRRPLEAGRDYLLKLGTARSTVRVEEIHRVIDASNLDADDTKTVIERHDVAEVTFKLSRALAFDSHDELAETSRFVIVDDYEIRGGGIIQEALSDHQEWVREKVLLRNAKWEPSTISNQQRATKYNQKAELLLITGAKEADRKTLGKDLEAELFRDGKIVYFLGIGSVLYGVDADIERTVENRQEHLRRLAEVANILLDAGVILIVTAQELTQEELDLIGTMVDSDRIDVVWVGDHRTTDIIVDVHVGDGIAEAEAVQLVHHRLQDRGVIFRPW